MDGRNIPASDIAESFSCHSIFLPSKCMQKKRTLIVCNREMSTAPSLRSLLTFC